MSIDDPYRISATNDAPSTNVPPTSGSPSTSNTLLAHEITAVRAAQDAQTRATQLLNGLPLNGQALNSQYDANGPTTTNNFVPENFTQENNHARQMVNGQIGDHLAQPLKQNIATKLNSFKMGLFAGITLLVIVFFLFSLLGGAKQTNCSDLPTWNQTADCR